MNERESIITKEIIRLQKELVEEKRKRDQEVVNKELLRHKNLYEGKAFSYGSRLIYFKKVYLGRYDQIISDHDAITIYINPESSEAFAKSYTATYIDSYPDSYYKEISLETFNKIREGITQSIKLSLEDLSHE